MLQFKKSFWRSIKEYLVITIGLVSYVLGWQLFLVPNNLIGGGVTGIASIVQYATGIKIGYTYFVVNVGLLIAALFVLGKGFGGKTVYAIILASLGMNVMQAVIPEDIVTILATDNGKLMSTIMGGILAGAGMGMTMSQGGSTGGTDIIALIVNKYRNVSLGRVLLYLDLVVIGSCWPIFHDWRMVVFGYVTLAVYTYALDLLVNSTRQDTQFIIFTCKSKEICDRIVSETVHSVTVINGEGYYSHQEIKVLITIVHKSEQVNILRMIQEIDPCAFVSQSRAEGVYGNGFNVIKA